MVRRAAAIAFVVLLAGCGGGDKAGNGGPDCGPAGGTGPRSSQGSPDLKYLTSVGVDALDCAERISFGFREDGAEPGYRVSYQPGSSAKTEDGSGNPIEIDGTAFLVVRLDSTATAELVGEDLEFTYSGPRRLAGEGEHVKEVVKTGDFEAVVTWVIGLDEERPFTVSTSGSRLSVDVG